MTEFNFGSKLIWYKLYNSIIFRINTNMVKNVKREPITEQYGKTVYMLKKCGFISLMIGFIYSAFVIRFIKKIMDVNLCYLS